MREGRLRKLGDPAEIVVEKRAPHAGLRVRRDPRELVKTAAAKRQNHEEPSHPQ